MFSLLASSTVAENVSIVVQHALGMTIRAPDPEKYWSAIGALQGLAPSGSQLPVRGIYSLGDDPLVDALAASVSGVGPQMHSPLLRDSIEIVRQGLQVVREYSEEIATSIDILVPVIAVADEPDLVGASASNPLGVIVVSPRPDWRPFDAAECIVHEATHQAHYLDEMVRGHFVVSRESIDRVRLTAYSTARHTERPIDLAFAAACVGAAELGFLESMGRPLLADQVCLELIRAMNDLQAYSDCFSARGRSLLREIDEEIVRCSATAGPLLSSAGARREGEEGAPM
jgi:hypothetical protein